MKEEEVKKKKVFCPLASSEMLQECLYEQCAWYDKESGWCAVLLLAKACDYILACLQGS